jgi:hypothetical protein
MTKEAFVSTGKRLAILGVVVVLAVIGIVVASSGGSSNGATKHATVTIDVKNAKPVGGVKKITIKRGGTLDLTVNSDTADEVHVHATDQHAEVKKGGSVHLTIKPTGTGNSEIELEQHKQQLAQLTIEP